MIVYAVKDGSTTEHQADLLVPIRSEGSIMIQLAGDDRKISEIAQDFEGVTEIRTDDGREMTEYRDVFVVCRTDDDHVQVRIRREN